MRSFIPASTIINFVWCDFGVNYPGYKYAGISYDNPARLKYKGKFILSYYPFIALAYSEGCGGLSVS